MPEQNSNQDLLDNSDATCQGLCESCEWTGTPNVPYYQAATEVEEHLASHFTHSAYPNCG